MRMPTASLAELTRLEAEPARREAGGRSAAPLRTPRWSTGRTWAALWGVGTAAALASAFWGRDRVLNAQGWPLFAQFWTAALRPDLSAELLRRTAEAAATTVAYAVVGTVLSVAGGVVLGVVTSETWWEGTRTALARRRWRAGWALGRSALAVPRGIHEAVWALFLLAVLGRSPLVAVLAIAIPFGAITAKVYSEMIDESPRGPYEALRAAGAGRAQAVLYAVLPGTLPGLTSYAFYRFECSIRSAVVLGMVGAGGLGFELAQSFQGLAYRQMWTVLYAVILLGALAERWAWVLRRQPGRQARGLSAGVVAGLVAASGWHLVRGDGRLVSERAGSLARALAGELVQLRLPADGWAGLLVRSWETVQMSLLATTLAAGMAVAVSLVAARSGGSRPRRATGWAARALLLVTRAVPPPVWALLALFVLVPGPLPGALALGVYTFGVLGRLCAEAVEGLDSRPRKALVLLGAPPATAVGYATLPAAAGQFVAYGLYRWEVATRDTVVVGVVGAAGLGRLLEQQRVAFDHGGMAATLLALIAVCLLVDALSAAVRRSTR
jgi:phosphonate transport system permease protein